MERTKSPKEILTQKPQLLQWSDEFAIPFGRPEIGDPWIILGDSSNGKSYFVMQVVKELCRFGSVLYESFEEGTGATFQKRLLNLRMNEVQGAFRTAKGDTIDTLFCRLKAKRSPKFIIIDSFQMAGYSYDDAVALHEAFPKKTFIWISQAYKGAPLGKPATRLWFFAGLKIKVAGYKASSPGRYCEHTGESFSIWQQGIIESTNNL